MDSCINCNIATHRCNALGSRTLEDLTILNVIRQWRGAHVNSSDHICHTCFNLAQEVVSGRGSLDTAQQRSVRNLCLRCRRSMNSQRVRHTLNRNSAREMDIYNVIQQWILPQTIEEDSQICHSCWVAADRAAAHVSLPSTSSASQENLEVENVEESQQEQHENADLNREPEPTIFLPDYVRAVDTQSRCFFEYCRSTERHRIPMSVRKMLLSKYKYYIPENNRLCTEHLIIESWDFITNLRNNYLHDFTAKHIQDMLALKEASSSGSLNFENIDHMEDHVVHMWMGLNKEQFNEIISVLPQLSQIHKGPIALAAYLIKLRTGESNERLSTLLKMSRRTLERWFEIVRNILIEHFVPRHLGLENITRD